MGIRNPFESIFPPIKKTENKTASAETLETIKIPCIAELKEPMQKILSGLRENINRGDYAAILGDDASGRLPALLFKRILENVYKKKNFESLKILFCTGRGWSTENVRQEIEQNFKDFLEKTAIQKKVEKKKILVVTDTIDTGAHLLPFTQVLKEMNIDFDIATIGVCHPSEEEIVELQKKLGGRIFWGQSDVPGIYARSQYSGVQKRSGPSIFPELYSWSTLEERTQARQDVEVLAKNLTDWYQEEHLDKE